MTIRPIPSRQRAGVFIASWRDLIPKYRVRLEKDCRECFSYTEVDRVAPGGTWDKGPWIAGRTFTSRSVPGRWIQWLGRKWFWKAT